MTQMVWRKNSEGKETNEQAAVQGVDLTQHGGEGIECRLVRTWQLMDAEEREEDNDAVSMN